MINDRSQYEFVTIPSEIKIDGGIMPARDVAGGNAWRLLRGEDPCFLLEGIGERRTAALCSTQGRETFTKMIEHTRLSGIASSLRLLCSSNGFCNGVQNPQPIYDAQYGNDFIIDNYGLAKTDFASSASDFATGGALVANNIRKLFYDFKNITHFTSLNRGWYSPVSFSEWETTTSHNGDDCYAKLVSAPSVSAIYYVVDSWYSSEDEEILEYSFHKTFTGTNGTFVINVPSVTGNWVNPEKTKAFGLFNIKDYVVRYEDGGDEDGDGVPDSAGTVVHNLDKYCVVPFSTCSHSGNTITVSAQSVATAASMIDGNYSVRRYSWRDVDTSLHLTQEYEVNILAIGAILELGDHTDISGIGWPWTPS